MTTMDENAISQTALHEQSQSALALADSLAGRIVGEAAPIQFRLAQSDSDRQAVYRLRYQVVIEHGWAQPEDLPDGLERDAFDERAIHIAGWDGDVLAATSRLVLPDSQSPLPTEQAFNIKVEPQGRVADMGRQIVDRDYSNVRHLVFAALLAKTWLEMRQRGFTLVCGDFSPAVTRLYRMVGFDVKQIGPSRKFWGEKRFPILVDVAGSVPILLKRWGNQ
ncbi:MAG: GNAT family N-acyltransferase [Anaerolineales bacterium]|jgi:N-acyl-L-homoserine lactone synthetase